MESNKSTKHIESTKELKTPRKGNNQDRDSLFDLQILENQNQLLRK